MTDIILLDGGMGQELIRRSGEPAHPLWSTHVMLEYPGIVADVHAAYADAGATVATTNSYAVHRDRLKGGASNHYAADGVALENREDQFEDILRLSLKEAAPIRTRSAVAGSVGPLGASYRSDLHPDEDTGAERYAEVAQILAPGVDLILFETIASLTAARACLKAGQASGRPFWLAFTASDEDGTKLRSGEPMAEAAAIAAEADAVLINCSIPEVIPAALDAIAASGVPFGAYANGFDKIAQAFIDGGTTADGLTTRQDLSPDIYADHAMRWINTGATIIGGCCEVGPAHIQAIHTRATEAGHRVVPPAFG